MQFVCYCGASVEARDRAPSYCPACGRNGTYLPQVHQDGFPHSFASPVLSAAALRSRGAGYRSLPDPWDKISPKWGFPFLTSIYGEPGAGKSTFALLLADAWPGSAIYFSLEEGLSGALADRAARLDVRRCLFGYPSTWSELVEQVRDHELVVIDSLQMLRASGAPATVRAELVDRASKNVVVISQVNAAGDVRGGKAISHFADVTVHLPAFGSLQVDKNRFGACGPEVRQWREE